MSDTVKKADVSIASDIIKKADRTIAVGVLQMLLGVLLILVILVVLIITNVWALFVNDTPSVPAFIYFICFTVGVLITWRGCNNYILTVRFRKVYETIGDDSDIDLSVLEEKLDWNREKLLQTMNRQIARGFWPDSFLDCSNGVLIRNYKPTHFKAESGIEAVDNMLNIANGLINDMATANRSIDDTDLKTQVDAISEVAKQIYSFIEKNPEKSTQVRKLTNYFLPTTVNLLNDYLELQNQSVKTENMLDSMNQIKDMLPTIDTAFKKQLNDLFDKKSMDVSVEIDVMTKMMDV